MVEASQPGSNTDDNVNVDMNQEGEKKLPDFVDVDDGSDDTLVFIGQMETLEAMADKKFELFQVLQVRQLPDENKVDAKVKVDETDKPIMFVQIEKSDPPQITGFKAGQTMEDEFSVTQGGDADMKDDQPQGQPISGMVDQTQVQTVMEMGFSKNVAEKALFMVQGGGISKAFDWID